MDDNDTNKEESFYDYLKNENSNNDETFTTKSSKEKKKINININYKLIATTLGIIIIIIGAVLLISRISNNMVRRESLTINSNNISFDITIDSNYQPASVSSAIFYKTGYMYPKVKISIKNNGKDVIEPLYNTIYSLVDEENHEIGVFNYLLLHDVDDVINFPIKPNETVDGWLYFNCFDEITGNNDECEYSRIKKLKVSVITGSGTDAEGNVTPNYKDYYFNLKQID